MTHSTRLSCNIMQIRSLHWLLIHEMCLLTLVKEAHETALIILWTTKLLLSFF